MIFIILSIIVVVYTVANYKKINRQLLMLGSIFDIFLYRLYFKALVN